MKISSEVWPASATLRSKHDEVVKWKHIPRYAMVTYSLRRVCEGSTATLVPQTVRRPYGFYANCTATSQFLARRKVIASLAFFFDLTLYFFRNRSAVTAGPHSKVTVRWPYGRLAMAVRWHTVFTLSWVHRKSYGGLTTPLRRPYDKLATDVRSPHGHLPVSCLWSAYDFLFHKSYLRRAVAVTFVTTTTVACKTLRFLKTTFHKP